MIVSSFQEALNIYKTTFLDKSYIVSRYLLEKYRNKLIGKGAPWLENEQEVE